MGTSQPVRVAKIKRMILSGLSMIPVWQDSPIPSALARA
jgi:hypothetical protein